MQIDYFVPVVESDRQPKLDDQKQRDLVTDALDAWTGWSDMIQDLRERALESRQLYLENRPDKLQYAKPDDAKESLSRVRRPVMAQAIDSTIAQQHLSSYPSDERFFKGLPRNEEAVDNIDSYERHVEARLSMRDFLASSLADRKNLFLDGTSCVWHPFVRKTQRKAIYEYAEVFGLRLPGKPKKRYKDVVTFEGTDFIPLGFEDWRVDPMCDRFDEAGFIWRRWVPIEAVKNCEAFKNRDDVESYNDAWSVDTSASNKLETYRQAGITPDFDTLASPAAGDMVLLYERWGDFCIDEKEYKNHVLIYSNETTFHYFGPNPYDHGRKPFTIKPYTQVPGTLYGKSMAADIIPLCHALDTLLNQAIDIISRTGNPTFTYLTSDTALLEFFSSGPVSLVPGEGIPVQSHDSIAPLVWDRGAVQEVEGLMQALKEEIRESTGGVPYTTGGASEQDQERTLGEVQILATGTSTRFQLYTQAYEEAVLKPYLEMVFENDRQFMTETVFIDNQTLPLTPTVVKMMQLRFDITGSKSLLARQKDLQDMDNLIAALPTWIQSGLVQPNGDILKMNLPEIIKRRMTLSNFRDVDNVAEVITVEQQQEAAGPEGMLPQMGVVGAEQGLPGLATGGSPTDMAGPQGPPGMEAA